MTNNNLTHLTNIELEKRATGDHLPGTLREAGNLLRTEENLQHRLTLTAEAHLASNMAGGRYNDHLEQIITLYLGSNDKELFIQNLRDGQRRIAQNKRF